MCALHSAQLHIVGNGKSAINSRNANSSEHARQSAHHMMAKEMGKKNKKTKIQN